MRFLCLHGMGTNSRIFEMQTAAIRHGLGTTHTFEYIDGAVPAQMAPGVGSVAGANEEYLQYGDPTSPESYSKALHDLENFLEEEGPFDGVMAFSQGAGLAASLLAHHSRRSARQAHMKPTFRFAVFFCGGVPGDVFGAKGVEPRLMSFEEDGEVIGIPTAHIWGAHDEIYPTFGPVLSKMCDSSQRATFVHQGGHEIPGAKDPDGVLGSIRAIKRVIQLANEAE
ncbi:hypothetical protein KVR01_012193 [Diaporthe batatas]|uniref:uncharacterized protein n=1 Tax=Diaporthe batatas TaxID=748121 RepID=UPI001D05212E|nr:uncharacterized protein KVR01_012193 [Diaporthe batatas]KAG8157921.1 hypothetical protein KVR01_012193 [Diaporthe batatas]